MAESLSRADSTEEELKRVKNAHEMEKKEMEEVVDKLKRCLDATFKSNQEKGKELD